MSRQATSFVLAYHGCERAVAQKAVLEGSEILQSNHDYDWLGPGAYFWESDPKRALEWAKWKVQTGSFRIAAVIGAVIDLRNCLDLVSREDIDLVREAYESFVQLQTKAGLQIPQNVNPGGTSNNDRVLRYLDCAVLRHLHEIIKLHSEHNPEIEPFDTVRGMFIEGGPAFPGSGISAKSHVQIAVRNPSCIKVLFYPIGLD